MNPVSVPALVFGTPRRLPKAKSLEGRVAVLDIAFAGTQGSGFEKVTQPFIDQLGARLRVWVDHHDHDEHVRFAGDPRFVLAKKSEHGACPEMIDPPLVQRVGPIDTICCHNDFDGLASAAKWMLGGVEPYPGCDADARAIDTRMGEPGSLATVIDRALRARPRDEALYAMVVRYLAQGQRDQASFERISGAADELLPIERETRRLAKGYRRLGNGVVGLDVTGHRAAIDKTLLLLLGQELESVSLVVDRDTVSVAARFDSGYDFLKMFGVSGGMPTRVALTRNQLPLILTALGLPAESTRLLVPVA